MKYLKTIEDINKVCDEKEIVFLITRLRSKEKEPDDLDILVKKEDFNLFVEGMKTLKYKTVLHDMALGGRKRGCQINLIKKGRIKIDLHKDFTWRKSRYLDLDLIWDNARKQKVEGVEISVPEKEVDVFLILINLIFEKTYITKSEWESFSKVASEILKNKRFNIQAGKYGWGVTWQKFKEWFNNQNFEKTNFPAFLPIGLVLFSYFEKLANDKKIDLISFAYYLFFRTRYIIDKTLPYE